MDWMVALGRLALFALFAIGFLAPVGLFCRYRRDRAEWRGEGGGYVAHADPWLPLVMAATGVVWLALLGAIR
jgi:hypothetical protein